MIFVLVHMSCATAWAWGEVPELLREAGHDVVAPDLDLSPGQTPGTHAAAIAAQAGGDGELVIAGHSYGGMVAPALADRLRDRVRALVVIDGLVPDPGDSSFAIRPHAAVERREAARRDGLFPPPEPDPTGRLVPMPISAFDTPVVFTPVDVPRTFVHCLRSDMGAQADRARAREWTVLGADRGHLLPLDDPALCARLLLDVG